MTGDGAGVIEPARCPRCGAVLHASLLELEDEDGSETLLLFDCPNGDFHTTVTQGDVVALLAATVRQRLSAAP